MRDGWQELLAGWRRGGKEGEETSHRVAVDGNEHAGTVGSGKHLNQGLLPKHLPQSLCTLLPWARFPVRLALQGLQVLFLLTGGSSSPYQMGGVQGCLCPEAVSLVRRSSDETYCLRCSVLPLAGIGLPQL